MAGASTGMYYGRTKVTGEPTDPIEGGFSIGRGGQYTGLDQNALLDAIDRIDPTIGGVLRITSPLTFSAPVTLTKSNLTLEFARSAKVIINHGSAIGAFDAQGSDITIRGLNVFAGTFVNDQIMVKASGNYFIMDGRPRFELNASTGVTTNPMQGLLLSQCLEPLIQDAHFLPNKGFRCINWDRGHGGAVVRARARNESKIDIGGTIPPRSCYEVLRAVGVTQALVDNFVVWGLGTLTTDELNEVFYIAKEQGTDVSAQFGLQLRGCNVGAVAAPRFVMLQGTRGARIVANFFGSSLGAIASAGEAAIVCDTDDGTDSGENHVSGVNMISDNIFETCASGAAAGVLYFKRAKKTAFKNNQCHGLSCTQAVLIGGNQQNTSILDIQGNYWDGDEINTKYGVNFENSGTQARHIIVKGNQGEGLLRGHSPGRLPVGGFGGLPTYDDGSAYYGANPSVLGGELMTDATTCAFTFPTDLATIPAVTAVDGSNETAAKACKVLKEGICRLPSGFGNFLQAITDSSGGSAASRPHEISNVVDLATFKDAVAKVAAKREALRTASIQQLEDLRQWGAVEVYQATTISSAVTNTISDSANALPIYPVGSRLTMTGWAGGNVTNNQTVVVVSSSASALRVLAATPMVAAVAGDTVIITPAWGIPALKELTPGTPALGIVDVPNAAAAKNNIATLKGALNLVLNNISLLGNMVSKTSSGI